MAFNLTSAHSEWRRRIDQALFGVVMEAYLHGVSTRKVDDLPAWPVKVRYRKNCVQIAPEPFGRADSKTVPESHIIAADLKCVSDETAPNGALHGGRHPTEECMVGHHLLISPGELFNGEYCGTGGSHAVERALEVRPSEPFGTQAGLPVRSHGKGHRLQVAESSPAECSDQWHCSAIGPFRPDIRPLGSASFCRPGCQTVCVHTGNAD